jgi:(1->4)-alpha-D-glucan 1-alpha-D-glucosylmutase
MIALRATLRLQFHKDFTIDDAVDLIPYAESLGISHVYASPLLKSRPGSTHGYDIVDHHAIDPELGGEPALRRLVDRLRAHGMGLILDIVPNHMGVGGADNAWWLDVLEWGRASPYAEYFDIDWDPPDATLRGKLLAPFLGNSYGEALEAGDLSLQFDPANGRLFASAYGAHHFPIDPRQYAGVLLEAGEALRDVARLFSAVGSGHGGREAMRSRAEQARAALRQAVEQQPGTMEALLAAFAPDSPDGRDRLHRLLQRQNYRLAWWRAAADEINWRRFFDINSLAGIRVELPNVFDDTHAYILRLYAEGLIDGVRIDHVDGLADPRAYCRKLRRRLDTAAASRPKTLLAEPAVIWVEKILAPNEQLPTDWLTDGTTGYDFMNDAAAVLHDPAGEAPLTALWSGLTGRPALFEQEAKLARRQILRESLFSELYGTAAVLHRIARRDLRTRDYTLTAMRRALEELLIHFPVYRIYSGLTGISETDARVLGGAMDGARQTVRPADRGLLELIGGWLAGEGIREMPPGPRRQERLRAMVRFQQLSSPTAAKSIEDTAFYRFGRLLSRNEVGSEPSQFALSPAAFHNANRERRRRYPRALLATATHDHKRGEDTRARIAVLSEIPDEWENALNRWIRLNAPAKRQVSGHPAPDPADEVMLYEMLAGSWPLGLAPEDASGVEQYRARMAAWQEKALREAKRQTSWAAPNIEYETACQDFLAHLLDPEQPSGMAHDLAAFAARIAPAGALNGLAQTLLRLTSPGVPDLYQGAEFWDFSLVDPDNRRPVDFPERAEALATGAAPADLLDHWQDGRVKQAVIARALAYRRRASNLFAAGTYLPLRIEGKMAEHTLAYARIHEGRAAIAVVTRLAGRQDLAGKPLLPPSSWRGTAMLVPRNLVGRQISDVLGGRGEAAASGRVVLADLLAKLPVALLEVR